MPFTGATQPKRHSQTDGKLYMGNRAVLLTNLGSPDNTDVATVNTNTGLVTAVAEGIANITATARDSSGAIGSASITVTVPDTVVLSIHLK